MADATFSQIYARAEPVNAPGESLTGRAVHAAKWRLANSVVSGVSQFSIGVILARLLQPSDFGLMALAWAVLGLANGLGDLGIASAIVQRKQLTDRYLRTAFTVSVAYGLATSAIFAIAAPIGTMLVHEPATTQVVRWLSVGFAIHGTAVVSGALLRRRLDFKRRFAIATVSYLVGYGGVAVTLAVLGYGIWSLVWGGLSQTMVSAAGNLASAPPAARPLVARSELADLLSFGMGMTAGSWANYLARNGDNVVVGRYFGAETLGLYTRAYSLMNLPFTYAAGVMSAVLFPTLSQLQEEPARLQRAYLLMTRLTATVSAPVMGTMAIAAPHLIVSVYGPQWNGTVVPLQILCAFGYFRALYHIGGIVVQSAGRVYGEVRNQIAYAVMVIVGALMGARFGISGVAWAVGVAIVFMFLATGHLALDTTKTTWRMYAREQVAPLIIGIVTCGAAFAIRRLLETYAVSSLTITLAVAGGAAVSGGLGMLWVLSEPAFGPLLKTLPRVVTRCVEPVRQLRHAETARIHI
jgi:PST family polysaccharide transporter